MFLDHHGRLRYPLSRSFFYLALSPQPQRAVHTPCSGAGHTPLGPILRDIQLRSGKNITGDIANFLTFGL